MGKLSSSGKGPCLSLIEAKNSHFLVSRHPFPPADLNFTHNVGNRQPRLGNAKNLWIIKEVGCPHFPPDR